MESTGNIVCADKSETKFAIMLLASGVCRLLGWVGFILIWLLANNMLNSWAFRLNKVGELCGICCLGILAVLARWSGPSFLPLLFKFSDSLLLVPKSGW